MDLVPDLDLTFGRAWREHRRYVLDIAFRTLGEIGEAEDVVQEAFARLLGVDIDEIHDVRAWLVVVVGRLCVDRLRLAHRQRETSTETPPDTAPHPTGHAIDPADRVTLDDRVCTALHAVLERLTPAETHHIRPPRRVRVHLRRHRRDRRSLTRGVPPTRQPSQASHPR
jgi:DNA-directed RNA polymerase specialized sigma24 family protein